MASGGGTRTENTSNIKEYVEFLEGEGEQKFAENPKHVMYVKIACHMVRVLLSEMQTPYYLACIKCNKKVINEGGFYSCQNCAQNFDSCNYRYILSAVVADFTSSFIVQFMGETADQIVGMSAKEFHERKEAGQWGLEEMRQELSKRAFKDMHLIIRTKKEESTFQASQDESNSRLRHYGAKVLDWNAAEDNKMLLLRLSAY